MIKLENITTKEAKTALTNLDSLLDILSGYMLDDDNVDPREYTSFLADRTVSVHALNQFIKEAENK